jgi:hypothetical protein
MRRSGVVPPVQHEVDTEGAVGLGAAAPDLGYGFVRWSFETAQNAQATGITDRRHESACSVCFKADT